VRSAVESAFRFGTMLRRKAMDGSQILVKDWSPKDELLLFQVVGSGNGLPSL